MLTPEEFTWAWLGGLVRVLLEHGLSHFQSRAVVSQPVPLRDSLAQPANPLQQVFLAESSPQLGQGRGHADRRHLPRPYKICARSYKPPFGGYGSGEPRKADCTVYEPFDTAERFKGKIYVLIGPSSISAPIMLGAILQDYELATLIGEKTSDTASFCASAVRSIPPSTKLEYSISTECYVRPSGILDDQPLTPDIPVETTVQDQLAGKDPVLNHTLELIRNGG